MGKDDITDKNPLGFVPEDPAALLPSTPPEDDEDDA